MRLNQAHMNEYEVFVNGWAGWTFAGTFATFKEACDCAFKLHVNGQSYGLGARPKDRVQVRMFSGRVLTQYPSF